MAYTPRRCQQCWPSPVMFPISKPTRASEPTNRLEDFRKHCLLKLSKFQGEVWVNREAQIR
eukprot:7021567-Pyramimonas_sp.AAC.1